MRAWVALGLVACGGDGPVACEFAEGTVACHTTPKVGAIVVTSSGAPQDTGTIDTSVPDTRTLLLEVAPFELSDCLLATVPAGQESRLTTSWAALIRGAPPFTIEIDQPVGNFYACGDVQLDP
jgi:hypothetical protein